MRDTKIKVGKAYKWDLDNKTIVLCIDWDLETFTGIVLVKGKECKDKVGTKSSYNADSPHWIPLKGRLKYLNK